MAIRRTPNVPYPLPRAAPGRRHAPDHRNLVLVVLGALRKSALAGAGPLSSFDILDATKDAMAPQAVDLGSVEDVLQALLGLGLVRSTAADGSLATGAPLLWEAAAGWTRDMTDGGHGGGLDRGDRDDDDGPRRFPEVLAHPILLALPREDFDALLEQVLAE